jgi:hypothetical protein
MMNESKTPDPTPDGTPSMEDLESIKAEFIAKYIDQDSPYTKANWFQKSIFSWVNPILEYSERIPFQPEMVYKLPNDQSIEYKSVA